MSVAEYFNKTYNLEFSDLKQPLIVATIGEKDFYLPTEFCTIDGVPESIRRDSYKMREVLSSCRKSPQEKFFEI